MRIVAGLVTVTIKVYGSLFSNGSDVFAKYIILPKFQEMDDQQVQLKFSPVK